MTGFYLSGAGPSGPVAEQLDHGIFVGAEGMHRLVHRGVVAALEQVEQPARRSRPAESLEVGKLGAGILLGLFLEAPRLNRRATRRAARPQRAPY